MSMKTTHITAFCLSWLGVLAGQLHAQMGEKTAATVSVEASISGPITDESLAALKERVVIRQLNLRGSPVTDRGLHEITKFTELESLDLGHVQQLTNDGLEHVSELASLKNLNLGGNPAITDDGLKSPLDHNLKLIVNERHKAIIFAIGKSLVL